MRQAGLPYIRFHDLRHTSASVGLLLGEHPKVVQERLGHSSIAITLDRYSHLAKGMQREGADRLGADFFAPEPDEAGAAGGGTGGPE